MFLGFSEDFTPPSPINYAEGEECLHEYIDEKDGAINSKEPFNKMTVSWVV